jgi:hypothetical protein
MIILYRHARTHLTKTFFCHFQRSLAKNIYLHVGKFRKENKCGKTWPSIPPQGNSRKDTAMQTREKQKCLNCRYCRLRARRGEIGRYVLKHIIQHARAMSFDHNVHAESLGTHSRHLGPIWLQYMWPTRVIWQCEVAMRAVIHLGSLVGRYRGGLVAFGFRLGSLTKSTLQKAHTMVHIYAFTSI